MVSDVKRFETKDIANDLRESAAPIVEQLGGVNTQSFKESGKPAAVLSHEKMKQLDKYLAELTKIEGNGGILRRDDEDYVVRYRPANKMVRDSSPERNSVITFAKRRMNMGEGTEEQVLVFAGEIDPKTGETTLKPGEKAHKAEFLKDDIFNREMDLRKRGSEDADSEAAIERMRDIRFIAQMVDALLNGRQSEKFESIDVFGTSTATRAERAARRAAA